MANTAMAGHGCTKNPCPICNAGAYQAVYQDYSKRGLGSLLSKCDQLSDTEIKELEDFIDEVLSRRWQI